MPENNRDSTVNGQPAGTVNVMTGVRRREIQLTAGIVQNAPTKPKNPPLARFFIVPCECLRRSAPRLASPATPTAGSPP